MKFYSEFIVMHADEPMPDEETFCPSFWQAEDFDSDGDFYADALEGRWTELRLTKRRPDDRDSVLRVNTLRQNRPFEPGILEVADLERYFDYHAAGRYSAIPALAELPSLAVTSLAIETPDAGDYREFLETVEGFLEHSGGVLVSPRELDRAAFRERFLECSSGH
jgi:hypothetical protein